MPPFEWAAELLTTMPGVDRTGACALLAVANSLLQAVWYMLSQRRTYKDLGADYYDRLHRKELERSLIRRLEKLGHKVILQPAA